MRFSYFAAVGFPYYYGSFMVAVGHRRNFKRLAVDYAADLPPQELLQSGTSLGFMVFLLSDRDRFYDRLDWLVPFVYGTALDYRRNDRHDHICSKAAS